MTYMYYDILWPPMSMHGRQLYFARIISFSNAVLGGRRTKLNKTLPTVR